LNRLIEVSSPTGTSAYPYDPLGNLASMTQNGQTTRYVVDPIGLGNIVGEYNGSGGVIANYTYGLGLTSRGASGGATAYYSFDGLGSTAQLTGTDGAVLNNYRYSPFGEVLSATRSMPNPFIYVGQFGVMNEGNGVDFMRARFYEPGQGRFLSHDPMGL